MINRIEFVVGILNIKNIIIIVYKSDFIKSMILSIYFSYKTQLT